MAMPLSTYRRILDAHTIAVSVSGQRLLYADRHYVDETCFTCFDALAARSRGVRRPDLTFAFADHTVPTRGGREAVTNQEIAVAIDRFTVDAARFGIELFGLGSRGHGIMHVSAPEQGLTLPGLVVVGSDSHMPTHGGLGALGLGIGLSEQTHVLATQTLWHTPLRDMRIDLVGRLKPHVSAKDVVLTLIARIGAAGAIGHAVEFGGDGIARLSAEQRMTLCNMVVEAGARTAIVPPDEVTIAYLAGRERAPEPSEIRKLLPMFAEQSDIVYDRRETVRAGDVAPMVTWGTSPEDALAVTGRVPDPNSSANATERTRRSDALAYMGLSPGAPLEGLPLDRVFIGSCTNGRIEDLREAASVVRGRRASVPAIVVPGAGSVKRQAEAEGLASTFIAAGFEWHDSGCSLCAAMNGDVVAPTERCASTSNRNFKGRQGPGSRTHLMSPAMAAAAAVAGRIVDVRTFP